MKLIHLVLCFVFLVLTSTQVNGAARPIPFNSQKGEKLLINSQYRHDFWQLIRYFETQHTNTYCGVASGVMVLNALDIPKPKVDRFGNHRLFLQDKHFFNHQVSSHIPEYIVKERGMRMSELKKALNAFNVDVKIFFADRVSLDSIRSLLKRTLKDPDSYLIVNYLREGVGQEGGGHYSPVGAYNEKEDKVLILDVSRYYAPPVWVDLKDLAKSMQPNHKSRIGPRGFIRVSKNRQSNA